MYVRSTSDCRWVEVIRDLMWAALSMVSIQAQLKVNVLNLFLLYNITLQELYYLGSPQLPIFVGFMNIFLFYHFFRPPFRYSFTQKNARKIVDGSRSLFTFIMFCETFILISVNFFSVLSIVSVLFPYSDHCILSVPLENYLEIQQTFHYL